jgi:hypothetical protein
MFIAATENTMVKVISSAYSDIILFAHQNLVFKISSPYTLLPHFERSLFLLRPKQTMKDQPFTFEQTHIEASSRNTVAWPRPEACTLAYRELFKQPLAVSDLEAIRAYLNKDYALGSSKFQDEIETILGRRTKIVPQGRPRKPEGTR